MMLRDDGELVGADFIRGVAVPRDTVRTDYDGGDFSLAQERGGHGVCDECGHARGEVLRELVRRETRALIVRAGFGAVCVRERRCGVKGADYPQCGAVPGGGERAAGWQLETGRSCTITSTMGGGDKPSVAVREHRDGGVSTAVLHDPFCAEVADVAVVLDVIDEHLFGGGEVDLDDLCTGGSGCGYGALELGDGVGEVHCRWARFVDVVELVADKGLDLGDIVGSAQLGGVVEFNGEGEGGDNGNCGCAADDHVFDSCKCIFRGFDGDVNGLMGKLKLVEDAQTAALVTDGLKRHGCC